MALLLAPYNNAMRLGQGFNSFTQEICVDNAVVGISDGDDSHPIVPTTYVPVAGDEPVKVVGEKKTFEEMSDGSNAVVTKYPSQIVTYSSKYINKLSDVSKELNVSGSLSIRYGEISGGGSGSYVNTEAFQKSDMNFLITVNVINQTINIKDQLQFWPINHKEPSYYTAKSLTDTYGDCFISGFQEGGIFTAMVSIRALDQSNVTNIEAKAHVALQLGAGSVEADAAVKLAQQTLNKESEITITVNWSGGGQLKTDNEKWSIETLQDVAVRFADLVAACPQRTHAILTRYTALRGFLQWRDTAALEPLDFEIANLYTSELLDVYMGYKSIWKDIHNLLDDLEAGKIELIQAPQPSAQISMPPTMPNEKNEGSVDGKRLAPFPPDFRGLDDALQTCRSLMVRIVAENDAITKKPELAINTARPIAYLRPQVFRTLLPREAPPEALSTRAWLNRVRFGTVGAQTVAYNTPISPPRDQTPQGIAMFTGLDLGRSDARLFSKLSLDSVSTTALSLTQVSNYSWPITNNILTVPKNDQGIFAGSWTMPPRVAVPPGPNPRYFSIRQKIDFPYPYDAKPSVVAFLTGFDVASAQPANACAAVANITNTSFELVLTALDSVTDLRASWFACPSDLKGVKCGSTPAPWLDTAENKLNELPTQQVYSDRVFFAAGEYKKPPIMVMGVRGFALRSTFNMRLGITEANVSSKGFDWRASCWADTQLTGASVSWISWERSLVQELW